MLLIGFPYFHRLLQEKQRSPVSIDSYICHLTQTDLTRHNVSFLHHLFGLVHFEQIVFYWLSPAPLLNDVHKLLAILANRKVQGDRPGQQVGVGAEHREANLEHSCRKGQSRTETTQAWL